MMSSLERVKLTDTLPVGERTYTFQCVIDESKCTGCGICAIECPSRIIEMRPRQIPDAVPLCTQNCVAENEVRIAMFNVRNGGSYENAWKLITEVNPFPACTGRTCPHPCEDACVRIHLDAAVNLHDFERFIGDYGIEHGLTFEVPTEKKAEKIAVIGGGPSGLTCACGLARMGYRVTVYEEHEKLGGMMRYGIPAYRIPKDVLDSEINAILKLGIEVNCGVKVGRDISLNKLKDEYDAIYLALGSQKPMKLGVEGEEMAVPALDFLCEASEGKLPEVGKTVVVIGGGSVAMDSAMTALCHGAEKVTAVCVESRYEMPAFKRDIDDALAKGVEILDGWGVKSISGKSIVLKKCVSVCTDTQEFAPVYDEDNTQTLPFDTLISAIGQRPDTTVLSKTGGVKTDGGGFVLIDDEQSCATSVVGIFAGGDTAAHSKYGYVAGCTGMGSRAARRIAAYLSGSEPEDFKVSAPVMEEIDQLKYNTCIARNDSVKNAPSCCDELIATLPKDKVVDEIQRCLVCATAVASYTGPQNAKQFNIACNNCHNCVSVCPEHAISFKYTLLTKDSDFQFSD